jgi:hypothetical protein
VNRCLICNKKVNKDDKSTWKQVTGWVGGPRKDSMRLREDTGKYAHDECVLQRQRGIAPDQTSLFDEAGPSEVAATDTDADQLGLFE